jgi:hypothetical protein
MKTLRSSHGVVSIAALDLRKRPDHRSELRSQLLLGESVRTLGVSRDGSWWRVENRVDGYRGWIRVWGIVGSTAARARGWERRAKARVTVSYTEVRARRGGGSLVSPLFWNSRVIAGRGTGSFRPVELPDGRRGWVRSASLGTSRRGPRSIVDRVRELLGVPYLWGGRTPLGLDCSAFTQQVLAEQGIRIPRDALQQFRAVRRLSNHDEAREGDLFFFAPRSQPTSHVGLAVGGGYYAHARGRVMIGSLDPLNPLFDKALFDQFRGAGRPEKGWVPGRSRDGTR